MAGPAAAGPCRCQPSRGWASPPDGTHPVGRPIVRGPGCRSKPCAGDGSRAPFAHAARSHAPPRRPHRPPGAGGHPGGAPIPRPAGRRRGTGLPELRQPVPHQRRDGRRDPRRRGRLPRPRRRHVDRQSYAGPRHLGRQGLGQRRRRRGGARGDGRCAPPRPRAADARAGALLPEDPHPRLRHRSRGSLGRQLPGDLDRLLGQSRRPRLRPRRQARIASGARTASRPPARAYVGTDLNRNYDYHWGCCGGSSRNPAAWNYRGPRALLGARDAGHPRLREQPRGRRPASRSGCTSRSTPTASRSSGRTATRRRTCPPT